MEENLLTITPDSVLRTTVKKHRYEFRFNGTNEVAAYLSLNLLAKTDAQTGLAIIDDRDLMMQALLRNPLGKLILAIQMNFIKTGHITVLQ